MLKLFSSISFLFFSTILLAQPAGFSKVSDVTAFKQKLATQSAAVNSLTAKFTQEKNLKVLKEKLKSTGDFSFKRPDKVRMEYKSPFQYLMVINRDKISIKDGQKTSNYNTANNKMFAAIKQLMMDCMQGRIVDNKSFQTEVFENAGQFLCVMKPVKPELKNTFTEIHVYLSKDDLLVSKLDMKEHGGDNTLIMLLEKKVNATIPDSAFSNF